MQKSQNILHYKGLGDVSYVKSKRARNLSIRINQQGELRVTIPRLVSQRKAERFFLSKQEWVRKRLNGLNHQDCRGTLPPEGGLIQIRGKEHPVHLLRGDVDVEAAIWRILQKEALLYLPGRVKELAEKHTRMYVRTNADSPADAKTAREFGAKGIGLCRTEHMFFEGERIKAMREMILAENEADRKSVV